jgi:hypothetical protein
LSGLRSARNLLAAHRYQSPSVTVEVRSAFSQESPRCAQIPVTIRDGWSPVCVQPGISSLRTDTSHHPCQLKLSGLRSARNLLAAHRYQSPTFSQSALACCQFCDPSFVSPVLFVTYNISYWKNYLFDVCVDFAYTPAATPSCTYC